MTGLAPDLTIKTKFGLTDQEEAEIEDLRANNIPIPNNEIKRMQIIRQSNLTENEPNDIDYERFCSLCKRLFNVPVAVITIVDVSRVWFKAKVGISVASTPRKAGLCSYVVLEEAPPLFIVEDASQQKPYSCFPLVDCMNGIRFYAAAALICDGVKIGTLCIVDVVPRHDFPAKHRDLLQLLGNIVAAMIDTRRERFLAQEGELAKVVVSTLQPVRSLVQDMQVKLQEVRALPMVTVQNVQALQTHLQTLNESVEFTVSAVRAYGESDSCSSTPNSSPSRSKAAMPSSKFASGQQLLHHLQEHVAAAIWEECEELNGVGPLALSLNGLFIALRLFLSSRPSCKTFNHCTLSLNNLNGDRHLVLCLTLAEPLEDVTTHESQMRASQLMMCQMVLLGQHGSYSQQHQVQDRRSVASVTVSLPYQLQ